ncbi:hypothetical protein CBS101457_006692 [Exobasidium rhododendri]|nr:hypothetical protein CBS101457_006692 [Exobasidium rhododendri]
MSHLGSLIATTHHCIIATRLVFSAKGWAKHVGKDNDVVLNTFNKRARARMLGITYTVDETVVVDSKADHAGNTVIGIIDRVYSPYSTNHLQDQVRRTSFFSPSRSQASVEIHSGPRLRLGRHRSSQAAHYAEPCSPLPNMNDIKDETREKLVDTESDECSTESSERATENKCRFRSKRSHSLDCQISHPPTVHFKHPFSFREECEEADARGLSGYKQDDEITLYKGVDEDQSISSATPTLLFGPGEERDGRQAST